MASFETKLSSQGQVSVPVEIRKRLEVSPGSVIEWVDEGDQIVVRRKGQMTWEELHVMLFPDGPPKRVSIEEMEEAAAEGAVERFERAVGPIVRKRRHASG